jgi:Carboxypeptidase regulatory-like domain
VKSRYTSARAVAVLSGLFLVLASGNVLAQGTASITGTVVDTSQAAVPGSEVILTNTGTAQSTTKTTSDQGFFVFPDLSPGIYKVTATKAGFKAWTQDGITLQVAQQITLYPQLQVGLATEQVEVTSTAAFLTTSSSTISGVIESQEIQQLPLNGRNALQLQELQPGVISTGTGGQFGAQQVSFSSSGGRDIDINYSLDGGINVNPFYALANYYPNPDALQEFSLSSRNYSAQFGRGSTDVSAVTRSGTNSFHGSAFEFLRNTALDSTPFFGTTVPAFHRNQFGGAIGGPILKNRLFFFASYQGTQQSGSPGNQVYTTIPLAERGLNGTDAVFPASTPVIDPLTGLQFPNNTIPSSRITSQPEKFFQEFLPAPNLGANSYQFSSAATQREHQAIGKVDYTLTKQDSVFVRYFLDDYPSTGYGNGTGSALGTSWLSSFPYRYQDTTVGWVHTFSPSLLNVAHVTYQRSVFGEQTSLPFSLSAIGYDVNTESAYSTNGLTPDSDLSITGAFGAYPGAPTRDIMPTWDVNDNLTWIKGRHTINTGFVIYHNRINELQNFFTGGSMTFNGQFSGTGASDFLLGDFSNYTQISGLSSRLHQTLPSAYVQDDVKLTPRLTVNAGLRVDIVSGYHSEDGQLMTLQPGQQSTVFPLATQGLLFAGDKGVPADIIGTRTDIAPRLGIAWDVFGNGKTSLRAGAGIFYIPMTEGISLNRQTLIQPFCLEVSLNAGDAENIWAQPPFNGKDPYPIASSPSGLKSVPFVVGGSETTMPTKWKTQVSNEWSLSLQQAVFKTGVFEADYVGSSSSHMFTSAQANWGQYINIDGGPPTESNLQQRRIYPDIGPIELDADLLSANYNALQISYNQRLANTLTLKSSYTWSKNLGVNSGEGAGGNGPRDPYNYHLDYGNVGTSEPQVWVTGFIWQAFGDHSFGSKLMQYAAGGWQLGGIISINSGTPLDIVSGLDNSLTGIGEDTPDLIGDWHAHNSGRSDSIAHWFNQGAFAQNATGTFGTFRPNTISGPGYVNFDINMQKNFAITERVRSEFRSSFYNAFNHANLGNPGTTLTSSNFGVINSINSSSSPRVIEFGLRILF